MHLLLWLDSSRKVFRQFFNEHDAVVLPVVPCVPSIRDMKMMEVFSCIKVSAEPECGIIDEIIFSGHYPVECWGIFELTSELLFQFPVKE